MRGLRRAGRVGIQLSPGLAVAAAYAVFAVRNAVDVIYFDEWDNVVVYHHLKAGTLTIGRLWKQHTQNRMLVPRMADLAVANWLAYDVRWLIFGSIALLACSAALLVLASERLQHRPLFVYAPVVMILFSLVQWQNTLWEFQLAWFLLLAAFLGALYAVVLSRSTVALCIAVVLAVVASLSSFQGLFVWPAVAVMLLADRRPRRQLATWAGAAVVTAIVYFYGFDFSAGGGSPGYALRHPEKSLAYFLAVIGGFTRRSPRVAQLVGALVLVLAVGVLVQFWRSGWDRVAAFPAALVVFALLFDLFTVGGRVTAGSAQALASRYTTYNLVLLAGIYLALLDWRRWKLPSRRRLPVFVGALAVASTVGIVLVVASATTGPRQARRFAAERRIAASVLRDYRQAPDVSITRYLCPAVCGGLVGDEAPFLESVHASVFARLSAPALSPPVRRAVPAP